MSIRSSPSLPGATMPTQKDRLIVATERLLCSRGLARVTTRDIAQEAKVAEGALYHHFDDKAELIMAVVLQSVGDFRAILENLSLRVGQDTVRKNLERVAVSAYDFHHRIAPMICSLLADQELLARVRAIMTERCIGPAKAASMLAAYLSAERRLGRVAAGVDVQTAAEMLLAASWSRASFAHFYAVGAGRAKAHAHMREAVHALIAGVAPEAAPRRANGKGR
jgi:AcrR family transcriptional regulator